METDTPRIGYDKQFVRNMVESALRITLLFVLLVLSYDIVRPFITPLVWGAIIAIAAFPLTRHIEGWLGGRRGLAATLLSLSMIITLVVPCYLLTAALLESTKELSAQINEDRLEIPAPKPSVKDWPLVGERIYETWSEAHNDLQEVVKDNADSIKAMAAKAAKRVAGGLVGVLMFVVSLLIAAGFMTYADSAGAGAQRLFVRLGGEATGGEWASLCVATVRSVLQGVVGVALIQAALCAAGLFVMGIPGAPMWSVLILLLAIAQLPAAILVVPIIIYAFSAYDTTPAAIFAVWMLFASLSDNFLKPLLMGRGLDIPMPVILIGAIGGMILSGIIGLFAGAVVLSISYRLYLIWLEQEPNEQPAATQP